MEQSICSGAAFASSAVVVVDGMGLGMKRGGYVRLAQPLYLFRGPPLPTLLAALTQEDAGTTLLTTAADPRCSEMTLLRLRRPHASLTVRPAGDWLCSARVSPELGARTPRFSKLEANWRSLILDVITLSISSTIFV